MAALRSITFEESLCEALSGLNLENVSFRIEQINKGTDHFTERLRPFLFPVQDFIVRKLTNENQSPSFARGKASQARRNDRIWERE